jgi:oxygen-dependent protoporphyrinogen oxidase
VTLSAHGSASWTGDSLRALSEGEAASLLGIQAKPEDLSTSHASFTAGMEELIQALAASLGSSLRLGIEVESVDLSRRAIAVRTSDGAQVTPAALVLAAPSWRVADLVRAHAPVSAGVMQRIRYLPSLTVSLAYRAAQIGVALVGTGFVVQENAAPPLRACTFASLKFPGRAPAGHVLLRAFLSATDQRAETVAHEALAAILHIDGPPLWSRVYEWPRGIPLYSPDHAARLADARRELDLLGSVALAGAGYDGAGVGACIKSGREAARKLMARSGSSVH